MTANPWEVRITRLSDGGRHLALPGAEATLCGLRDAHRVQAAPQPAEAARCRRCWKAATR